MGQKSPSKTLERQALQAQREAERSRREALRSQQNMQQNFAANLAAGAPATAVVAGTAETLGLDVSDLAKRRKARSTGLASTLGITE